MRNVFLLFAFFAFSDLSAQDGVKRVSPCVGEIFLPKVFHSSGDSVNDLFLPRIEGSLLSYSFKIFNRWGMIVFETKDVLEGWNGRHKDTSPEQGVYLWVISWTCEGSADEYSMTGDVTVLR